MKNLTKKIPHKWRIQSLKDNYAQLVAYIDSRDVQNLLDEEVGTENWQDKYYSENGMLFCSIGIKCGDDWVWKSDTGSESNMEAQKGHSSDAFKRAAVKWGIGRFLYDLPIKVAMVNQFKKVIDDNGKVYYDPTELVNKFSPETKYLFNKK